MSFGKKLVELRKINGLSQEQLANELMVTRQAVSKWETDKGYPDIEKIIFISEKYNISLDELFERKDKEFENTITKTKTILSSFSSQLTNLSPAQCKVLLVYLVLLGLWVIYSFGYAIGKFIAYIE